MTSQPLEALRRAIAERGGRLVVLTGAGISAESGIPTFRGPEGFWTAGSRVYRPQELATQRMFSANPTVVWPWYLWRQAECAKAEPNAAHRALVRIESALGDRFTLVTQNVDGLHHRSGSSSERTMEIHGNINAHRCAAGCGTRAALPTLDGVGPACEFDERWKPALTCSRCGEWMRPHVLWFDEYYDEAQYRFESAIRATEAADALVVVGTTGATSLPAHMLEIARNRAIPIIDVNPDDNPFARAAARSPGGWLRCPATQGMVAIAAALGA